ncbi:MAG: DUF4837 family protein, partial [Candidatus Cloacimonetes bacterium]|nr:DUF4837 family protein [Candidatus Cloacimonadota bacterium]
MRKVLFIMIFGSLLFSCGERDKERKTGTASRLPMAWGHPQTVYVFVDDNIWTYAERPLRESLERFYFTTENENYFEIKKAEYNNLEQFYRFNNLIFYADYASTGKVSEYVRGILGDEIAGKIGEEKVGIYPRNNLWANDQLVVFILGNNEENL